MTHWPEKIIFIVLLIIAIVASVYAVRMFRANPVFSGKIFAL